MAATGSDAAPAGDTGDHRPRRFAFEHQDKIANALAGLGQPFFTEGEREPYKTLRRLTERGGIQHRHARLAQQAPGEFQRGQSGFADVDQHEHAGIGIEHGNARAIRQTVHHQIAAMTVDFAHAVGDFVMGLHRLQRGFHDKPRQAIKHAQHQGFGVGYQGLIGDDPAGAPAGHGMGFRQAADHHATLGHAGQGRQTEVLALEREALIDLVHHHPQVMGDGEVGNALQLFAGQHHAGGVVRVGEENRPGFRGDGFGQHGGIEPETGVRRAWHAHQRCTGGLECRFVGHVHRVEGNHFVAGSEQAHRGGEQRVLRPGDDDHVGGLQLTVEQLAVAVGDGFAQGLATGDFGVVGVALAQGVDRGIGDEIGGGEIRVTDAEDDHILAPALGFKRCVVNIPGGNAVACYPLNKG